MAVIILDNTAIEYSVSERPRRKHVAIQVVAANRIVVLIPPTLDPRRVESWLRRESHWVLKVVKNHSGPALLPARQFAEGDPFWFQGELLRLRVVHRPMAPIEVTAKAPDLQLWWPLGARPAADSIRAELGKWYLEQAYALLPRRLDYYEKLFGVRSAGWKVAEYKSRWGSCSHQGVIAFNWRLVQAPIPVIDYVVVHELVHLKIRNHGPEFRAAVGAVFEDYADRRRWLRQHAPDMQW